MLDRLATFAAVADTASFTAAAKQLGLPKSTVSREIARLEEEVGTALFHRTTRRVVPTPAGALLHERIAPLLAGLRAAVSDAESEDQPTGTLRVTAPVDVGATLLPDVLARLSVLHPELDVDVNVTNAVIDLAKEGVDCAVRVAAAGKLPSRDDLAARRLGTVEMHLYASPRYLARAGTPKSLADLAAHTCVAFLAPGHELPGRIRMRCNDMFFAREAARSGAGIAQLPTFLADEDVASGLLTRVLPDHSRGSGTLWFVTPHRKRLPARVRVFRDLLVEHAARTLS